MVNNKKIIAEKDSKRSVAYGIFFFISAVWLLWVTSFVLLPSKPLIYLFVPAFLLVVLFVYAKVNENIKFLEVLSVIALLALGITIRMLTVEILKTVSISDFGNPDALYRFLSGEPNVRTAGNISSGGYFSIELAKSYYTGSQGWFGQFMYVMTLYNIFGATPQTVTSANIVLFVISGLCIFKAMHDEFGFAEGIVALAIFSVYPEMAIMVGIHTPDLPVIALLSVGIYLGFKAYKTGKKARACVFSGLSAILLALSNTFKATAIVYLIAYVCTELLIVYIPRVKNLFQMIKSNWQREVSFLVCFIAVISICNFVGKWQIETIIGSAPKDAGTITAGYAMSALESITEGEYSYEIVKSKIAQAKSEYGNDDARFQKEYRKIIFDAFMGNVKYFPKIMVGKLHILFSGEDYFFWANRSVNVNYSNAVESTISQIYRGFANSTQAFLTFFAAIGCVFLTIKKEHNIALTFAMFMGFGYVLMLCLTMTQARYKVLIYPEITLLTSYGFCSTLNAVHHLIFVKIGIVEKIKCLSLKVSISDSD
jgi:hypothetical protein